MQSPSIPIFRTPLLQIGRFCCPVQHPHFHDSGPIVSGHLIVFPRTPVRICHPAAPPIVADPNVMLFYNLHQCYRRDRLSDQGDRCEWFAFAPELLVAALQRHEPRVADHPDQPFRFTHAPCAPSVYLRQRQVIEHVLRSPQPDLLYVEESMLSTLELLLAHVYQPRPSSPRRISPATLRKQREIVQAIQALLATRFQEKVRLTDLAATVYLSPYELCRLFRRHTGQSIHHYLNQLRLYTALESVTTPTVDLTELALSLGYDSHSHFTSAFRRLFGQPPTALRSALGKREA